ncbi:MAG: hypothetical protein ABI547_05845 [Betaproteobacteria bacterium]
MSGPITASYLIGAGVLMLAEAALKQAHAMELEYDKVVEQMRTRELELAQARRGQQAARLERIAAQRREAERQTGRLERLRTLAQTLAPQRPDLAVKTSSAPAAPGANDDAAWTAYLRELDAAVRELENLLAKVGSASAAQMRAMQAATAAAPNIDEVLSAYVLQRQLSPGLDSAQAEQFRQTASRVLNRLELAPGDAMSAALEALARSIVLAPSLQRAEALASELRLAVQREGDARAAQQREMEEARGILEQLAEDAPVPLLRALEQVAAGAEHMDEALRRSAQQVLDTAAADRAEREQQAAAYVLEQSLRDLGYEVEDIEATLFADGGTVHFRRPGWENYFVRMRVNPREHTANFNVVRASGDEQTAERARLDALAEDRWCAEFPRLMQTLAARGLTLDVTRRLEAGAVPVQIVDGASLPQVHAETDDARPRGAPLARKTP